MSLGYSVLRGRAHNDVFEAAMFDWTFEKMTAEVPEINDNYSPKWRWLVVDIYRTAKQQWQRWQQWQQWQRWQQWQQYNSDNSDNSDKRENSDNSDNGNNTNGDNGENSDNRESGDNSDNGDNGENSNNGDNSDNSYPNVQNPLWSLPSPHVRVSILYKTQWWLSQL